MKTLIKSLALALTLSMTIATASMAEAAPGDRPTTAAPYKTGFYQTASGQLNVAVDKEAGGAVDIRLKNPNGVVLYSEHMGKHELKYRVRLNLNELEDGVYQLIVTNGVDTKVHELVISTRQPTVTNRVIAVN